MCTPSNTWFLRPTQVQIPNGISINSAIFAGLTIVTEMPTDHTTPSVTVGGIWVCCTAVRSKTEEIRKSERAKFCNCSFHLILLLAVSIWFLSAEFRCFVAYSFKIIFWCIATVNILDAPFLWMFCVVFPPDCGPHIVALISDSSACTVTSLLMELIVIISLFALYVNDAALLCEVKEL